jgi:hypothetical protein
VAQSRLVIRGRSIRWGICALTAAGALALVPGVAHGASSVQVANQGKGPIQVLSQVHVSGVVSPVDPAQPAEVVVTAGAKEVLKQKLTLGPSGNFGFNLFINRCCAYKVAVNQGPTQVASANFTVRPPKLKGGPATKLFHQLLQAEGYHGGGGRKFNRSTRLAVMAFRKVNGMGRSGRPSQGIFRMLLEGRGAFNLAHPEQKGKHVEVDLSRQVMVLAEDGVPRHTFHISSGTGGTPTVTGKYHFYMKQPGYNAKRMYYSVYFVGGYATHGYNPVPTHPASHGCVRNPIPFARFIYNWISIGDPIWVYH